MLSVMDLMIILLASLSFLMAIYASWTGLSVYVYNERLSVAQRRFLTASLASAMLYLPLISLWALNSGWQIVPQEHAISWISYHLLVLFTVNGYHQRLRKELGFKSFGRFWTKWKDDARGGYAESFYRTFISHSH